jgi:hypothetical protein
MFNRTLFKTVSTALLLHSVTRGKAGRWGISFPDFSLLGKVGIMFSRKFSWMRLNSDFYSWNERGSRKTTESFL